MNAHDLIISDHRDQTWDPGAMVQIPTRPQLFLTDTGPNGKLVHRGNPITWLVDLAQCIPFLNFNGSGSQASVDAAAALANQAPADPGASSGTDPGLGVFAQAFGLAPTTVPGQSGSVGAPAATGSGQDPLPAQSAASDAAAFQNSWTPQEAAAAARPNTPTPTAAAASAPTAPAPSGPFAYIRAALGGK